MKNKALLSLVLTGALAIGAASGSYAWFTSKAASSENIVKTGKLIVNLDVNKKAGVQQNMLLGVNTLAQPGDTLTLDENGVIGNATFEVVNSGDFDLAYLASFKLAGNENLAKHIIITDWKNGIYKTDDTKMWSDHFINNGTYNYNILGTLDGKDGTTADGKLSLSEWLSSANNEWLIGAGADGKMGWDVGGLKPGYKFKHSIKLVLDENTGDSFQGQIIGITYNVLATQAKPESLQKLMVDNKFVNPNAQALFTSQINNRILDCNNRTTPVVYNE